MWVWSPWKSIVSACKLASALRVAFFVRVKKKKKMEENKSSVAGFARRRDLTSSFKTCMWWRRHTEVSRLSCFCSAIPIEFHRILTLISLYSYLLLSGNKVTSFFFFKCTNRTVLLFFQLFFFYLFFSKNKYMFHLVFFFLHLLSKQS